MMLTLPGHELKFKGIDTKFRLTNIDDSSITKLAPGESVTDEFDIAATTDLSEGGRVTVKASGLIHLVTDRSVSGSIPFESNTLTMDVDGAETAAVTKAFESPLTRRTKLEPDTCNSTQIEIIQTALKKAVELSNIAVDAAVNGPEKEFGKFFKSTDAETRASVSYRYRQVAQEAGSTAQGTSFFSCNDSEDFCHGSIVAYTWHSSDERVIPCDGFYDEPVFSKYCTQSTTSGILLHEFTHVEGLLDPRAEDHAYGFDASQKLPADKAFTNADNYAYYASREFGFTSMVIE